MTEPRIVTEEEARAALSRYGDHDRACDARENALYACTCGFVEMVERLTAPTERSRIVTEKRAEHLRTMYGGPPTPFLAEGRNPGTDGDIIDLLFTRATLLDVLTKTADGLFEQLIECDGALRRLREEWELPGGAPKEAMP